MSTTVTVKGQVTIPKKVREHLEIGPGSVVDFEPTPDGRVFLVNKGKRRKTAARPVSRFGAVRGAGTVKMTTQQIMRLTRGED